MELAAAERGRSAQVRARALCSVERSRRLLAQAMAVRRPSAARPGELTPGDAVRVLCAELLGALGHVERVYTSSSRVLVRFRRWGRDWERLFFPSELEPLHGRCGVTGALRIP